MTAPFRHPQLAARHRETTRKRCLVATHETGDRISWWLLAHDPGYCELRTDMTTIYPPERRLLRSWNYRHDDSPFLTNQPI